MQLSAAAGLRACLRRMRKCTPAAATLTLATTLAFGASTADAVAPAPCYGVPQITDVVGDGHHQTTDVTRAWLSEDSGHLQAVIEVHSGAFRPEHDDEIINGSAFIFLFTVNGSQDFVRMNAAPDGTLTFDYGTHPSTNVFTVAGTTTGFANYSAGPGTAVIDVPTAAFGIASGAHLTSTYVLTYDGISGTPDWVDHAPGGQDPTDPSRGADYTVGSCSTASGTPGSTTGTPAPGVSTGTAGPTTGTSGGGGSSGTQVVAVQLHVPANRSGSGPALVRGAIVAALGGVPVDVAVQGEHTATVHLTTSASGTFAFKTAVRQTTTFRAVAQGVASTSATVTVHSTIQIRLVRKRSGALWIMGVTSPLLPGKVLLLASNSVDTTASAHADGGRFRIVVRNPAKIVGRYQIVAIPNGDRAERVVSRTFSIS